MKAAVTHAQVVDGADAHKEIDMKRKVYELECNCKSKKDFHAFIDEVVKLNLVGERLLIVMNDDLNIFHKKLGLNCADKVGMTHLLEESIKAEGDDLVYEFVGKMVLDTILKETYYIFSKTEDTLYRIEGEVIDESKTAKKDRKSTAKSKSN